MKVDRSPFFLSPKLSASSFAMPSRPMKRSRSTSADGQADRPLKRVSLAPMNDTDVSLPRPVFHAVLPLMNISQQRPSIVPAGGYSMTPLWGLVPQSDNNRQSPLSYENPADDGDVRMDCDTTPKLSTSPRPSPLPSNSPLHGSSDPTNAEEAPSRIPKPLTNCPSLEMSEMPPPAPGQPSQVTRPGQTKRPRFTMGPRSDCDKCRAGVKGHWGHFT